MVVNRRKKVVKYRGHTSHGCGHHKKRRGAGSRGGRGRAGTGKRAGQKKAGMPPQLGRFGFLPRRGIEKVRAVNLSYFTPERLEKLVRAGQAVKEGSHYSVDLEKMGYQKLLGGGLKDGLRLKLKVRVLAASASAEAKITEAGGEVIRPAGAEPAGKKGEAGEKAGKRAGKEAEE